MGFRIEVIEAYKSLKPNKKQPYKFNTDFVVLTGENGAGKTNLLESIKERKSKVYNSDDNKDLSDTRYVPIRDSINSENGQHDLSQFVGELQYLYQQYKNILHSSNNDILGNKSFGYRQEIELYQKLAKELGKNINTLTEDDFKASPSIIENNFSNLLYINLSRIFKSYQIQLLDNRIRRYLAVQENFDNPYLTEDEFKDKYNEPPWKIVDQILKKAKMPYTCTVPVYEDRDQPYYFELLNNNNEKIHPANLSSGEKVIFSLVKILYSHDMLSQYSLNTMYPQVLLLDEPDASLHPSMAQYFINIIKDIFVNELKIKVIITTHSPSTVALAPEGSIYLMDKNNSTIEHTSKDKALKKTYFWCTNIEYRP